MERKAWSVPELCQLGVMSTEYNTLQSDNIDKTWVESDGHKYSSYS